MNDGTSVADAMRIQGNVFRRCVETCPAADVAPKSESEFDSIPVDVAQALKEKAVKKAKAEVAREIFEEIETLLCRSVYPRVNANGTITPITSKDWHIRCDDYDAIKKKYTEDKG